MSRALVVGAAILRHGCVLSARRAPSMVAAGGWELPGGKVEQGESSATAIVRELREELGVAARVVGWLDGEVPIGATQLLRVAVCETVDEPVPTVHDAVRWLAPEELDEVAWLEPDLPFLPQLKERLLDGEPVTGGNTTSAVRIGDTVRRETGPWTPAVHALLDHLHDRKLRAVPRVHGIDGRGREMLDFLPGEVVDVDTETLSAGRLVSLARWTRDLHQALHGFQHAGPWRMLPIGPTDRLGHNDLAPYNVAFNGDEVAGVFDWDFAGPTTIAMELAHQAWTAVPLFRAVSAEDSARRLGLLADAYGDLDPSLILETLGTRVGYAVAAVEAMVGEDAAGGAAQKAAGEPARTESRLADFLRRAPAVRSALAGRAERS